MPTVFPVQIKSLMCCGEGIDTRRLICLHGFVSTGRLLHTRCALLRDGIFKRDLPLFFSLFFLERLQTLALIKWHTPALLILLCFFFLFFFGSYSRNLCREWVDICERSNRKKLHIVGVFTLSLSPDCRIIYVPARPRFSSKVTYYWQQLFLCFFFLSG